MSAYCRVLATGKYRITCSSASHVKQGGKPAVDIVKSYSQTDDIIAHSDGKVTFVQTGQKNNKGSKGTKSYGNMVKIDHSNGIETLYAHLATVVVKKGQTVHKGDIIGRMGNTGNSYGAHLHWEVRKNGIRIDPTPYLNADIPDLILEKVDVMYSVAANNKWLPGVKNFDDAPSGYAGLPGKAITKLKVCLSKGSVMYRVSVIGGGYLPWVTDLTDYAGNGKKIDKVQIKLVGDIAKKYNVFYQVKAIANDTYYPWVKNYSLIGSNGYAGVKGKPIDRIRIRIERK